MENTSIINDLALVLFTAEELDQLMEIIDEGLAQQPQDELAPKDTTSAIRKIIHVRKELLYANLTFEDEPQWLE